MAFQTSRHLPVPPDAVFRAFTDATRLARWWGPAGFRNTFETCEFVTGGRWKYVMHGPNGSDYNNESVFKEVVPNERVVIRHVSKPRYELTITLTPKGTGTTISWHQAFEDPRFEPKMREVIEPANEQNLDRLAADLAAT